MKRAPAALALVTISLILVCAGPGAHATTYYVDPGGSGHSLTIQHAINICLNGDTILVAAGTYAEHIAVNGKEVVIVSESGPEVTIIDPSSLPLPSSVGVYIFIYGSPVVDGFTIINGAAGGIRIDDTSPTIRNCVISGNDSSLTEVGANGGGIVMNGAGTTTIQNCTITYNHRRGGGGGIYAINCDSLAVENCEISGNGASESGGGIYLENTPSTILTCTISDNQTAPVTGGDGGGIMATDCDSLLIENCVISGNSTEDDGGGLYITSSTATILGCSIIDNYAESHGGGIVLTTTTLVLLEACSINDNTAGWDVGGVATGGHTTFRHCDILGNEGPWSTGGIMCGDPLSLVQASIEDCTIAYNSSNSAGAALRSRGFRTAMARTIIAFNDGHGFYTEDGSFDISCCDLFGNTSSNYIGTLPDQTGINDNISEDPLFCDQPSYDTFIYSASPCAAANSPCGELIGRSGVACTSLPDLIIDNVEFDDYYPPVDGTIQATIKIKNVGHKTAYGFFTGYYYDLLTPPVISQSGNIFFHTDSLAAGDSLTHWIHYISNDEVEEWSSYFQVDYTSAVAEIDENNNVSGPHLINWTIPPTDGWPVPGGGDFHSSPVIALLDNDPRTKEVVIGCDDGYLYAYSAYGTTLPGQWPVNLGSPVYSSPAVGNIIGDYHNEIVVGCGAYLYAFDWAGTQLWTFGPSQPVNSTPALADLDDDGLLEILFSRKTLTGDNQLCALEGDGTIYPGSWPVPIFSNSVTSPAVGDMDQDGDIEIAVISSGISKLGDSSMVHLFNADGTYFNVMNWPVLLDTLVTCSPVMGNVTVDPKLELIAGGLNGTIYAINLLGNIWPVTPQVQGSVDMSLALAQLDMDDQQEIIAASRYWNDTPFPGYFSSVVTVLDNNGTVMSGWPQGAGTWITGLILPSPVAFYERILDGSPGGHVNGWEGSSTTITGFPLDVEGRVYSSVAIGDLRGNGYLDMVVATSADSVYAFGLGVVEGFETSANLCWPFYRNDKTRSGCYFVDPVTDAGEAEDLLPAATALKSIHPNPFNPSTTIAFDISKRTRVRIGIYDAAGRMVSVLNDAIMDRGRHEVIWNGMNGEGATVASGVYFCRLNAGEVIQTEKMVLLR